MLAVEFRVLGVRFRDLGLGYRVEGSGFRVWGEEIPPFVVCVGAHGEVASDDEVFVVDLRSGPGFRFRVRVLSFVIWGKGFECVGVQGFGVASCGCRVSGWIKRAMNPAFFRVKCVPQRDVPQRDPPL